ncbi:MAG: hypothetical protein Tsb0021_07990 [Chlamydiales bacterium]
MALRSLFFFILIFPITVQALIWESSPEEEFQAAIAISDVKPRIGETIIIEISGTAPQGYSLDDQRIKQQLLQYLNVVGETFTITREKIQDLQLLFEIKTHVPGNNYLNFLTIPFIDQEENQVTVQGNIFPITVTSPSTNQTIAGFIKNSALLEDLSIIHVDEEITQKYLTGSNVLDRIAKQNLGRFWKWSSLKQSLSIALFILLTLGILYRFGKPLLKKISEKKIVPEKEATRALEALNPSHENCYEKIGKILKEFLHKKYRLHTLSLTTPEIEKEIEVQKISDKSFKRYTSKVLREIDEAKFSKTPITSQMRLATLQTAIKVVNYDSLKYDRV